MTDFNSNQIKSTWEYARENDYSDADRIAILRAYLDVSLPGSLSILDSVIDKEKIALSCSAGKTDDLTARGEIEDVNSADSQNQSTERIESMKMSENEMVAEVTKSEGDGNHPASHYLIVEDPEKPTTWHLRVRGADGKVDRGLMGGAWAALHEGYRGNRYGGPDKEKAIEKLKALYKSEGADTPDKSNKEKASMDDKEKEVKETPEEEKKEAPEEQKKEEEKGVEKDMMSEYEAMKASLEEVSKKLEDANREKAEVETKLQASEAQLAEVKNQLTAHEATIKEHRVNELRSKLVGSVLDEEEFTAKQETLLGLPAEAIELMTRNVKKEEKPTGRLNMAASEQKLETQWALC